MTQTTVLAPLESGCCRELGTGRRVAAFTSAARIGTRFPWVVATALAVALVVALVPAARDLLQPPTDSPLIRLDLEVPGYVPGALAISPDGRFIVYTGQSDGERRIWLRPLDAAAARPLAGTENAANVFWSPDSRNIAFMTDDGTLKRVDVEGGPVQTLAKASVLAWGSGAWSRDDAILHTMQADTSGRPSGAEASDARGGFPIGSVSSGGGDIAALTAPDVAHGETGHFVPRLLPDGDRFVYIGGGPDLTMSAIYLGSRTTAARTALVPIEDLVKANRRWNLAYADGYLLYPRGTTLVAHRFDADSGTVVGEPRTVAQNVDDFAVSSTGMLVYSERAPSPVLAAPQERRLSWFDRSGRRVSEIDKRGAFAGPALSRDARRVAVTVVAPTPGVSDISIIDAERGASLPITVDEAADGPVVWSLDGARIAFSSGRGPIPFTPSAIYEQSAGGTGPQRLLFSGVAGELVLPSDWSSDVILFSRASKVGSEQMDIWVLQTSGEQTAYALLVSPSRKRGAKLSPNGRWILYTTDESGRDEVVVQPYPALDRQLPISTRGGSSPRWRSDGREIFYVTPDGIAHCRRSADIRRRQLGARTIARAVRDRARGRSRCVRLRRGRNGERFLVSEPIDEDVVEEVPLVRSLRVIVDWTQVLTD